MVRLLQRVGSAIATTRTTFSLRHFSTADESLSWGTSSKAAISKSLKTALISRKLDDAWVSFTDFRRLYGFPNDSSIFHTLLQELSYSSEPRWLNRAHALVSLAANRKPTLLTRQLLTKLCLSLARSESHQKAADILRLMFKLSMSPPMNLLRLIVLHFVKTKLGTCLASTFLSQSMMTRPDTKIFNLVLGGCVRFGLGFRAERVLESMARADVVADANSVRIVARIHEMNGQRDELKKYKPFVDRVRDRLACHYAPFYDSLLSLHFKFDDFDSVSELVREICADGDSSSSFEEDEERFLVPIGSENLRDGLRLAVRPWEIEKDIVLEMGYSNHELIEFREGKLVITDAALGKLVELFKRVGKIEEFSKLLLEVQRESRSSRGTSLCSDVIEACVWLEWVHFAHDMLDDFEAFGSPASRSSYALLLRMYFKRKMLREAKVLVTQMRENNDELHNFPDKLVILDYLSEMNSEDQRSDLVKVLTRREDRETVLPPKVYGLNSSIRFFCKAKMMEEAIVTYRRMQKQGIKPTKETFASLVSGFFSLESFREITFLWGDMKRNIESGNKNIADGDLFERLAVSFLRGGYFERVMEVIEYMYERKMFVEKSMYRDEFLKLHEDLYRNLKASKAKTEAQKNRLRYVLAFRKWAGIEFQRKPYNATKCSE